MMIKMWHQNLISKKFLHKFCQIEDFAVANGTVHRYEVIEIVRCGNAALTEKKMEKMIIWKLKNE